MPYMHKILIVDDDPELREALVEQLSLHEEFEAVAAENGIKGVQAAKASQIDLVIMDVGGERPGSTHPRAQRARTRARNH
jgi:DNA-binding response OmpR family regulator